MFKIMGVAMTYSPYVDPPPEQALLFNLNVCHVRKKSQEYYYLKNYVKDRKEILVEKLFLVMQLGLVSIFRGFKSMDLTNS